MELSLSFITSNAEHFIGRTPPIPLPIMPTIKYVYLFIDFFIQVYIYDGPPPPKSPELCLALPLPPMIVIHKLKMLDR